MAPDLLDEIFETVGRNRLVLDPMSGSGSVLSKALARGHRAIGFDMDPLAVLLSRSSTSATTAHRFERDIDCVISAARRLRVTPMGLPWLKGCEETSAFVRYWFAETQAGPLARIASAIAQHDFSTPQSARLAKVALSKIIITKHRGASLAWDVSHSRPHRVLDVNDFDVEEGFARAARSISRFVNSNRPETSARVRLHDARYAHLAVQNVDHIVTSPPYLNAIDYLRGHKFALIWMGYSIPQLRSLRARTVGTERGSTRDISDGTRKVLSRQLRAMRSLPSREANFLFRYIIDLDRLIASYARSLRSRGGLTVVLGNSRLRDVFISSSSIFRDLAQARGLKLEEQYSRRLDASLRYLPESDRHLQLDRRMKREIVQRYRTT